MLQTATRDVVNTFDVGSEVRCIVFSPSGEHLAIVRSCSDDDENGQRGFLVWNVAAWKQLSSVKPLPERLSIAYSRHGRWLAVLRADTNCHKCVTSACPVLNLQSTRRGENECFGDERQPTCSSLAGFAYLRRSASLRDCLICLEPQPPKATWKLTPRIIAPVVKTTKQPRQG